MRQLLVRFVNLLSKILTSIESMFDSTRADKLLLAAFVVAILRQMGVNGHFIGYDPASNWSWFQPAEVLSGIAMAILIGVALAYIARRWRKLNPQTWADWIYWSVILTGMVFVLIAEIFYTSVYAYAAQRGVTVSELFSGTINILYNIAVAGVLPLMAILIGIVTDEDSKSEDLTEYEDGWLTLIEMVKSGETKIMPTELADKAGIHAYLAQQVIQEAYEIKLLE